MIQDDQSQYTISKTLQRLQQDSDKGSVNITGLPAGEYSVRVYDNMEDYDDEDFAYKRSQLLHILSFTRPSTVSTSSAYTVFVSGQFLLSQCVYTVKMMFSYRFVSFYQLTTHITKQHCSYHDT